MLCALMAIVTSTGSVFRSAAIIANAMRPDYGSQAERVGLGVTPSYTCAFPHSQAAPVNGYSAVLYCVSDSGTSIFALLHRHSRHTLFSDDHSLSIALRAWAAPPLSCCALDTGSSLRQHSTSFVSKPYNYVAGGHSSLKATVCWSLSGSHIVGADDQ